MSCNMKSTTWFAGFVVMALVGCGGDTSKAKPADSKSSDKTGKAEGGKAAKMEHGEHGEHGAGPHGGTVFELGGGKYHAEFNVDHPKQEATIYVLGGLDEKKAEAVKATTMLLSIKSPAFQVDLKASPQPGDAAGSASAFIGKHEKLAMEQELEGTASIEIDGKPYSGDFKELPHSADHKKGENALKTSGGTQAEKELYLKAGGIYTEADVKANGDTVPSVKFAGISWPHDDDLKAGDKICPVTMNKADPRCVWTVNAKKYEFCCPPCLDKFVKWAKTTPEKIKPPEAYTHK